MEYDFDKEARTTVAKIHGMLDAWNFSESVYTNAITRSEQIDIIRQLVNQVWDERSAVAEE
jgi:hypothetical protein